MITSSKKDISFVLQNDPLVPHSRSIVVAREEQEEIRRAESEVKNLSADELERDISEIKNDIEFIVAQTKADLGSYAPRDLNSAIAKISFLKRKEEMMKDEYARRRKK